MDEQQPIHFRGDSLDRIKSFPDDARREMGYQLSRLEMGLNPADFKPMKTVGRGVYEVRVSTSGQAFRSFYVANLGGAIYVLHAFEKKSRRTARADLDLGARRYRALLDDLGVRR
ncbi:MAG: type II toxin-antitoxin system RelE/ParE family toxin [Bacteroidota bacterium]